MKKTYIVIIVLVLIALVAFFIARSNKLEAPTTDYSTENGSMTNDGVSAPVDQYNNRGTTSTPAQPTPPVIPESTQGGTTAAAVKEFTVSGQNFSFTPSAMTVKKGDKVRITFKNVNGNHDFNIDEFNVKSGIIKGGEQKVVEFTADKTGSFQYYCSVGTHRQMGMWGTLKVE